MAFMITTDCINCNACMAECPNDAIYEPGTEYHYNGQTFGEGSADFWSSDYFYVVPEKCTECKGFFDEPQCLAVCPIECCVADPNHSETEDQLLAKKSLLDEIGRD